MHRAVSDSGFQLPNSRVPGSRFRLPASGFRIADRQRKNDMFHQQRNRRLKITSRRFKNAAARRGVSNG
eukprot:5797313-Karenia_brevis.AAC.1